MRPCSTGARTHFPSPMSCQRWGSFPIIGNEHSSNFNWLPYLSAVITAHSPAEDESRVSVAIGCTREKNRYRRGGGGGSNQDGGAGGVPAAAHVECVTGTRLHSQHFSKTSYYSQVAASLCLGWLPRHWQVLPAGGVTGAQVLLSHHPLRRPRALAGKAYAPQSLGFDLVHHCHQRI